jgi:Outer membrane protein beta-barrel domain
MRNQLFFALTLWSFLASAQSKNFTSFGLKGGINRSIVNGYELDGTKTGFIGLELYGAFFADTELNTRWRFENEILFSWTDDYYFIEMPLHIKYCFAKKTFILLGPKLDMIASNDDQIYDFNNFGVSIELGVQYEVTKRIVSEIRFAKGLVKQINDYALDIYDGRRNTIRLGLGLRF